MMKISKQSWHYRMLIFCGVPPYHNLCGYFWQVVGTLFIVLPCKTIMVVAIGGPLLIVLGVAIGFAVIAEKTGLEHWYEERRKRRITAERGFSPPKKSGLFWSWLRAKKERVCPLIEFADDSQPQGE